MLEKLQPFDLVIFLGLLAMFVLGYFQGIIRRLIGIAVIVFALFLGAFLRQGLGDYLAQQWTTIRPEYSYMVAFAAVFVATVLALTLGAQIAYRPAPLLPKYPVLDEFLGGILGLIEGIIILAAFLLITDPYFSIPEVAAKAGPGEFGPIRSLHNLMDPTVTADFLRTSLLPGFVSIFGFLLPKDVHDTFATALTARR